MPAPAASVRICTACRKRPTRGLDLQCPECQVAPRDGPAPASAGAKPGKAATARAPALPRVPERSVQESVKELLRFAGCAVYDTSQPLHPAITPGVPDLIVFCPRRGLFFVEVKAEGGRLSPAQREFQARCTSAGITYLVGGVEPVRQFLFGET